MAASQPPVGLCGRIAEYVESPVAASMTVR
jgi:hypothetical protein